MDAVKQNHFVGDGNVDEDTPGTVSRTPWNRKVFSPCRFRTILACLSLVCMTASGQSQHSARVCNTLDGSDCYLIDTSVMGGLRFEDYRVSSPTSIQFDPARRLTELAAMGPAVAKTLCAASPVAEFVNTAPTITFSDVRAQIREVALPSGMTIEFLEVLFANLSTSEGYTSPSFGFKMSRDRGTSEVRIAFRPGNPGLVDVIGLTNEVDFAFDPIGQTAHFDGPLPVSAPLRQALFAIFLNARAILESAVFTTLPATSGLPLWSPGEILNLAGQASLIIAGAANPDVPIAPKTSCAEGSYPVCVGTENMVAFQDMVMMWGGEYLGLRTAQSIAVLRRNLLAWANVNAPILDPASSVSPILYATMELSKPLTMLWPTLRNDPSIGAADRQTIDNWINNRLLPVAFIPGGKGGSYPFINNWGYFGSSIQMADAIRHSDHLMFANAVQEFYVALNQLRSDGSFPLEAQRSACSAAYQNVGILHLVSMAEMAATQGYDLYGMSVGGKRLETAIQFLLDAYANPALIDQYSQQGGGVCGKGKPGDPADFSFISNSRSPGESALAWVEAYITRFPETSNAARLRQIIGTDITQLPHPMYHSYIGLNATCAFHKPLNVANYQGMWWVPTEGGWGINFTHQGDIIFVSWFTYDTSGKPYWLSMVAQRQPDGSFAGSLDLTKGPPNSAVPFDPTRVTHAMVGTGRLTFSDVTHGTFSYTVDGISQVKALTRFVFAAPVPACTFNGVLAAAQAVNYQDMWWVPAESGWGINFTHQGDTIFASWFIYDGNGPTWVSVTLLKTGARTYAGALNATTGPPFNSVPFDPTHVTNTPVGTATVTFTDGANATFVYTLNGVERTKALTRFVFVAPGTVCQ
jgi:hypothetical protein